MSGHTHHKYCHAEASVKPLSLSRPSGLALASGSKGSTQRGVSMLAWEGDGRVMEG